MQEKERDRKWRTKTHPKTSPSFSIKSGVVCCFVLCCLLLLFVEGEIQLFPPEKEFVVCCLLFDVCCLMFVVCCLLFVVCCLVVCCLLLREFWYFSPEGGGEGRTSMSAHFSRLKVLESRRRCFRGVCWRWRNLPNLSYLPLVCCLSSSLMMVLLLWLWLFCCEWLILLCSSTISNQHWTARPQLGTWPTDPTYPTY